LGRTPGNIVATRPLRDGVIADFDITEVMLKHFISKVYRRRAFPPRVVVCIPAGTTSVEQNAVIEAVTHTVAREAYLIEEPRAAALGAGLDIFVPSGSMVVDIGGGTADVAVLSMGEVVTSNSVKVGGDKFDEAIVTYIKREYNLLIGERTAELLKMEIGCASPESEEREMSFRGRDLVTGLPKALTVTSSIIREAIQDPLWSILQALTQVLEQTPPELAGDIIEKGIVLTGGGSMLRDLDRFLSQETGVPFYMADDPVAAVVLGTGKVLEHLDVLRHSLISSRRT